MPQTEAKKVERAANIVKAWTMLGKLLPSLSLGRMVIFYLLSALAALSEVINIGAVIPLLAVLLDPNILQKSDMGQILIGYTGIENREALLLFLTLVVCAAAIMSAILRVSVSYYQSILAHRAGHELSGLLFGRAVKADYDQHFSHNSSELASAVSVKVQIVIYQVILPILIIPSCFILLISVSGFLLYVNYQVAFLLAIPIALVYAGFGTFSRRAVQAASSVIDRQQEQIVRLSNEAIGGLRDIKISNSADIFIGAFRDEDKRLRRAQFLGYFIATCPRFIIEALGICILIVLAWWLGRGDVGLVGLLPTLAALALGAQRLLPIVQMLFQNFTYMANGLESLNSIVDLLNLEQSQPQKHAENIDLPFAERLSFEAVSYQYPTGQGTTLQQVDVAIEKGELVGLVGPTGSGKSTLLDLLMGLIRPSEGRICVDGTIIDSSNYSLWQRHIAHVPQHIFLTDNTIRNNVLLGAKADSFDAARYAAAVADAGLQGVLDDLPEGDATIVGERGMRLSGGQIQRIGIARALYTEADFLVLDEATSALDSEMESTIMDALRARAGRMTVLMVAHRIASLRHCDRILSIASGRLTKIEDPASWIAGQLNQTNENG